MGRGTTLVEAALLGRTPFGCDVNPLSAILVRARLSPPGLMQIRERLEAIKDRVKPSDRVAAMRALEKLAMSGSISVDDLRDRMIRQVRTIRAYLAERGLTTEQVELLIELVHADWRS